MACNLAWRTAGFGGADVFLMRFLMTDISGLDEAATTFEHASHAVSAAADTQGVHPDLLNVPAKSIAPFIPKLRQSNAQKSVGETTYAFALAAMTDGVRNMAQEKNVRVNPEEIPALAANALNALDPAITARLTKGDLEAAAI